MEQHVDLLLRPGRGQRDDVVDLPPLALELVDSRFGVLGPRVAPSVVPPRHPRLELALDVGVEIPESAAELLRDPQPSGVAPLLGRDALPQGVPHPDDFGNQRVPMVTMASVGVPAFAVGFRPRDSARVVLVPVFVAVLPALFGGPLMQMAGHPPLTVLRIAVVLVENDGGISRTGGTVPPRERRIGFPPRLQLRPLGVGESAADIEQGFSGFRGVAGDIRLVCGS